MDLSAIARQVLDVGRKVLPMLTGGAPEVVAAIHSISTLIQGVKPHADAPTAAELDTLYASVQAGLLDTADRLGDG